VTTLATAWVERRGGSWSVNTRGRLMSFSGSTGRDDVVKKGVLRLAGANDTALAQSWGAAASIDSGIAALDGNSVPSSCAPSCCTSGATTGRAA
jgi:hypothetical protein